MPIMGGLDAIRNIREFDLEVPIYVVTANAFDSDRSAAYNAGCNGFLTKPIKKYDLETIFPDILLTN